jgi:hypothetical protein
MVPVLVMLTLPLDQMQPEVEELMTAEQAVASACCGMRGITVPTNAVLSAKSEAPLNKERWSFILSYPRQN